MPGNMEGDMPCYVCVEPCLQTEGATFPSCFSSDACSNECAGVRPPPGSGPSKRQNAAPCLGCVARCYINDPTDTFENCVNNVCPLECVRSADEMPGNMEGDMPCYVCVEPCLQTEGATFSSCFSSDECSAESAGVRPPPGFGPSKKSTKELLAKLGPSKKSAIDSSMKKLLTRALLKVLLD